MDIRTEMESLPTADGLMPAYLCTPVGKGPHPAVIVVMEAFGLNAHIKNVAERVAREGYVAIAPDFFYRFGSPIVPYEDVPRAIGYIQRFDWSALMAEMGVVIHHLKNRADVRGERLGAIGFCVGARSPSLPPAAMLRPSRWPSPSMAVASVPTPRQHPSISRTASSAPSSASSARPIR